MSTATGCDCPLRDRQICAAARPAAAMLACAAAATRNDDGSIGSSPVSVTFSSAAGSPPAAIQMSLRISLGPGMIPRCYPKSFVEPRFPGAPCPRRWKTRYRPKLCLSMEGVAMAAIDPLTAGGVMLATAATDAVYVMFTSAVVARRRVPAATWSSVWYLLSSYAVISYTENWVYVLFAAVGSWLGAFATITFLHRPPGGPPVGAAPE